MSHTSVGAGAKRDPSEVVEVRDWSGVGRAAGRRISGLPPFSGLAFCTARGMLCFVLKYGYDVSLESISLVLSASLVWRMWVSPVLGI